MKSYKQIKDDLDGLRLLVEKSELWVYKSKSAEEKSGKSGSGAPSVAGGQAGSNQSAPLVNGATIDDDDGDRAALQSLEDQVKILLFGKQTTYIYNILRLKVEAQTTQ